MNVQTNKKGFTIIEVVLVLAIAGLIFLMVFIALPALQRNQRDTARKSDVSTISAAVNSYTGNNRGSYPTSAQLTTYITDVSDNTDKTKITLVPYAATVSIAETETIVVTGAKCAGTGAMNATTKKATQSLTSASKRQYSTVGFLEAGGGTSYCLDS